MLRASRYEFGPFKVDVGRRILVRGDEPVPVTARTFDTLLALLERRGEMVDKDTLMTAVWADTNVEEGNLAQQISLLRKALGEQPTDHTYVATVPRRGYRFVAPVRVSADADPASPAGRVVVGRQAERAILDAAFRRAAAGEGRMVCLAGEPGIGKSTIAESFLGQFATGETRGWIARGRCSERLAGDDAYLPILEALDSLATIARPIDAGARLRELAPTWAELLHPSPSAGRPAAPSQERLKRELARFIGSLAGAAAGVIFIDDVQWVDESTADALGYLAMRLDRIGIVLLCAYRPEELASTSHPFRTLKLDLQARGICTDLAVPFLSRDDVAVFLEVELGGEPFPTELAAVLHARTEGNPLFLTDLVRDMRARGTLVSGEEGWHLARPVPEVEAEWPESVRSMVERAIARVSEEEAKVLTAGSVQGAEFDSATLARSLALDAAEVEERLDRAGRTRGLVRRLGEARLPSGEATTRYAFVHVLYQNAFYATLSRGRRAALSGRVADALRVTHAEQSSRLAQQLGLLYAAADRAAEASSEFHLAAEQALAVGAAKEAVRLTKRALDCLELLPPGAERDRRELALRITLGVPLAATTGYANPEVEQTYGRARDLAIELHDEGAQFAALWGLWVIHHVRADLDKARATAAELLAAGERTGDARVQQVAHTVSGYTIGQQGEIDLELDHLRRAAEVFRPEHHQFFASVNALDPSVAAPAQEARLLCLAGARDAALSKAESALELARTLGNPNTTGFALVYAGYVHQMRDEPEAVLERTAEALALGDEHGLADVIGWATVWRGWALARRGESEGAIASMRHALAAQRSFGSEIARGHQLALLAEALILAGRTDEALDAIAEGLDHVARTGDRYYEPELHRLRGEIRRGRGEDASADLAEASRTAAAMNAAGLAKSS